MNIQIKKLTNDAIMPALSNYGDAGLDLCTTSPAFIPSGGNAVLPTGLAFALPHRTFGQINPRSKLAAKYGIVIGARVVDSGYRGEVMVNLINLGPNPVELKAGDKIAQMVVMEHHSDLPIVEVPELKDSDRGKKGINDSELRLR